VTYLDSNIVIYSVEGSPVFGPKAEARLVALRAAGEPLAVSELSRMECCTLPLARGDFQALRLFDDFFALPDVSLLSITPAVFRRATVIRATHGYEAVDAIHLATPVEGGCQTFLTHDTRLSGFPDLTVEILT
jgi:predicted nucleic acid-binding protein